MEYLHVASDIAAQSLPVSSLWTLTFLYLYFKSRISCVYYVLWASYIFCLFLFVIIAIKTYNTSPSLRNTFLLYYLLNQSVSSVAMMVNLYSFPRLSACCSHCFDCTQHFCVKLVPSRWCPWCTVQPFWQNKINKCKYMWIHCTHIRNFHLCSSRSYYKDYALHFYLIQYYMKHFCNFNLICKLPKLVEFNLQAPNYTIIIWQFLSRD